MKRPTFYKKITIGFGRGQLKEEEAFCRNASAPNTLQASSESAETESLMKYNGHGKTSSGLLAEMQANALQRTRGKTPPSAHEMTAIFCAISNIVAPRRSCLCLWLLLCSELAGTKELPVYAKQRTRGHSSAPQGCLRR